LPVLQRPSSNIGRVGIYNFPFGACSRFTRVAACQVAAALWLTSFPKASAGRLLYPTVWVATGMNRQFPGRDLHPLVTCALVAHQYLVVSLLNMKIAFAYQYLYMAYDYNGLCYIENIPRKLRPSNPAITYQNLSSKFTVISPNTVCLFDFAQVFLVSSSDFRNLKIKLHNFLADKIIGVYSCMG
jgi:hypothetical protein